jgi:Holliday junction DNA helicase RuvA
MIGFLSGQILETDTEHLYLRVGGVGYEILAAQPHLEKWGALRGESLDLWIYTHVREDTLHLYGFESREEKTFFLSLLKVNGVGPKMALSIFSGAPLARLIQLIEAGDAKGISALPRVGKKTAEQIILTLKGKLVQIEAPPQEMKLHFEIVSALVNLGFKSQIVEEFVTTLPPSIEVEEGVRKGLVALSRPLQK